MVKTHIIPTPRQSSESLLAECRQAVSEGEVPYSAQRTVYDISPRQVYSSSKEQDSKPRGILSTVVNYLTKPSYN